MGISKPDPLIAARATRAACPVCGKVSYSATGIHPQCAMNRAATAIHLAAKANLAAQEQKSHPKPIWSKRCPRCRRDLSARRAVCDCGYSFLAAKTAGQ
jgi:hypothetical protein